MGSIRYAVNCSLIFKEFPLHERPKQTAAAGFTGVEFWWPFSSATPSNQEVDEFIDSFKETGTQLVALNLYAGDMPAGERGVLSHTERQAELLQSLEAVKKIAQATGVSKFNALYGHRVEGITVQQQKAHAVETLGLIADSLSETGDVLLEAVSGVENFPLQTFADCLEIRDAVIATGRTNVGILADLYHLAANGDDVDAVIANHSQDISHVQVADFPGRNEIGTGTLPITKWLDAINASGYDGWVGLEYNPQGDSHEGLKTILN